ncbi:hypothetical protein [Candidatus Uabimicrobium sp. HlEnr_7]|uniref:hypothetical protein n=1 Tax=Candidatus Uabimicrobium helgolandensis TaxID=3095367 RepID=UPI0035585023
MTKDIDNKTNDFYNQMFNDLTEYEDGIDFWEKSKDVLEEYLQTWAQEKAIILYGDKTQRARLTVEKGQQQITFIKEGLRNRFKTTALNLLISRLKDTFAKHIVPHLLWRK